MCKLSIFWEILKKYDIFLDISIGLNVAYFMHERLVEYGSTILSNMLLTDVTLEKTLSQIDHTVFIYCYLDTISYRDDYTK